MTTTQLPVPLYQGTAVTTQVTFLTPSPGLPTSDWPVTDPTTVTLSVVDGTGTETTYTYGVGNYITRVSTGVYSAQIDTSANPGLWRVKWTGTGACAVVNFAAFLVTAPLF